MVNKDPKKDISKKDAGIKSEESFKKKSKRDQELIKDLIREVNEKGYHIQYTIQLSALDKSDRILVPILLKYYELIDDPRTKHSLIGYLGKRGLYEITEFLLAEFKKPNTTEKAFFLTRRGCTSSALYSIRDKRYIKAYIELIKNKDTRYDSMLIGSLLGKLKAEEALPVLIAALDDPESSLQSMAIRALGNFKGDIELIPLIEPFMKSDNKNLKSNARNAINKINGKKANSELER